MRVTVENMEMQVNVVTSRDTVGEREVGVEEAEWVWEVGEMDEGDTVEV